MTGSKIIKNEIFETASSIVAGFEVESLFEVEPDKYDIPKGSECRIILTSRFKNDIESLVADKRNKVNSLISEFYGLSAGDIHIKLKARNSKKFKGIFPSTFKFRVTNSERIVFVYGNTIANNELIKETDIIFLAYVEIHDEQEQLAIESRRDIEKDKAEYSRVVDKVKGIVDTCYRDEIEMVQPLYFAASNLPILSQEQQGLIKIQPPAIFRGSAGSGKTILSLAFYEQLCKTEKRIAYITLTDNMRKHAHDLLVRAGIENRNCFTFEGFAGDMGGREILRNPERLIEILPKHKKSYPSLTEANVYTYIRGVIKGGLLSGNRKMLCGLISREEFHRFAKSEKLSAEEVNVIYDAAIAYQDKLEKMNRFDDNDLAAELLSNPKEYDCIVVDEVQDLTELQIKALVNCCSSKKMFFFGDPNQVINPTVVDFGKIGALFYGENQKKVDQKVLKKTWRCGPKLIEYINKLTKLRKQMVGKQDWQDDEDEISMRQGLDETYWASYVDDPVVVDKVLDFANLSKDCIVIVNDDESLAELEKRLPELEGRVFTVIGIKGLEYRDVIIYNVVSDNELSFLDMLGGGGKRSTLHRMVFNKYYVACTRAQDRLFICERNGYNEELKSRLFIEQKISPNNDYETLCKLISTTKNVAEWLTEALKLKEGEAYKQAKFAFLRAGEYEAAQVCDWYIEWIAFEDSEYDFTEKTRRRKLFAMDFFDYGEFEKAEELFQQTNDHYGLILARKCGGQAIPQSDVRKAIQSYSRFNQRAFDNIAKSDYIDIGNDEIRQLTEEIFQMGTV